MLKRKADDRLRRFHENRESKVIFLTGVPGVGKTSAAQCLGEEYTRCVTVDFTKKPEAVRLFDGVKSGDDLLLRLSALAEGEMVRGDTLLLLDGVTVREDALPALTELAASGRYQLIVCGQFADKAAQDAAAAHRDAEVLCLHPLDFEEFLWANGIAASVIDEARNAFREKRPADSFVHEKLSELFRLYLIVGGMPGAVQTYLDTRNLQDVARVQKELIAGIEETLHAFDPKGKQYLAKIFSCLPDGLNGQNKRFFLKNLNENQRFSRFKDGFSRLSTLGVTLPTVSTDTPAVPLCENSSDNLFKLFLCDVGLLCCLFGHDAAVQVLSGEKDLFFGALHENAAAEILAAHGFPLYYFSSKKDGETDFLIERGDTLLPVEIKSGKEYPRHVALSRLMADESPALPEAFVFSDGNTAARGKFISFPLYMITFLTSEAPAPVVRNAPETPAEEPMPERRSLDVFLL